MFTMSIAATAQHVHATASGPAGLPELSGLAGFISEYVRSRTQKRVLVNLSNVEPSLNFTDDLRFGGVVWELLGGIERVALVVPRGYQDAGAIRAAKLAGVPLKTFLELADAKAWIAGTSARHGRMQARAVEHAGAACSTGLSGARPGAQARVVMPS